MPRVSSRPRTIVISRDLNHSLSFRPWVPELDALKTLVHTLNGREGETQIQRAASPLTWDGSWEGMRPEYREMPLGLLPAAIRLLRQAGHRIVNVEMPTAGPLPASDGRALDKVDPSLRPLVRLVRSGGGLIRRLHGAIPKAQTIVQMVQAFPRANISIVSESQSLNSVIVKILQSEAVDCVHSSGGIRGGEAKRVVIGPLMSQACEDLWERNILLMPRARDALSERGKMLLQYWPNARRLAWLDVDDQLSRGESDWLVAHFGFETANQPRTGCALRPVQVFIESLAPSHRPKRSRRAKVNLAMRALHSNQQIDRVVQLAQAFTDSNGPSHLDCQLPAVLHRLRPRGIIVLVADIPQACSLLRRLPGWCRIASPNLHLDGLPSSCRDIWDQRSTVPNGLAGCVATYEGLARLDSSTIDLIIRADGRDEIQFQITETTSGPGAPKPLTVIDFDDRTTPALRQASDQRILGYALAGHEMLNRDRLAIVVDEFLRSRPQE